MSYKKIMLGLLMPVAVCQAVMGSVSDALSNIKKEIQELAAREEDLFQAVKEQCPNQFASRWALAHHRIFRVSTYKLEDPEGVRDQTPACQQAAMAFNKLNQEMSEKREERHLIRSKHITPEELNQVKRACFDEGFFSKNATFFDPIGKDVFTTYDFLGHLDRVEAEGVENQKDPKCKNVLYAIMKRQQAESRK